MTARRTLARALLVAEAWLGLALVDCAQLVGFSHVHRLIRHSRLKHTKVLVDPYEIVWAVEEACVWYVKRAPCLQRSAVATCMLRRHGLAAQCVIGYRAVPFESHAWVELNGAVVNDRPQYPRVFTVLDRL